LPFLGVAIVTDTSREVPYSSQLLIGAEQALNECLQVKPQILTAAVSLRTEVEVKSVHVGDHAISHETAFAKREVAWYVSLTHYRVDS
jgi:hypothetical protein